MNYYVIYENPSEYTTARPVYLSKTLEDAEAYVMDYADWYCPKGTCEIRCVDQWFRTLATYSYREGKLVEYVLHDHLGN